MSLGLAALLSVVAVAAMIAALLAVRRKAPAGGFFSDTDRAAGIFGFIGTAFSVLLAFVIFLALEDYTNARSEAMREADSVLAQFEVAQLFPQPGKEQVQSELVCYGRTVIANEWPRMRAGQRSTALDGWVVAIERTIDALPAATSQKEGTAFDKFFDDTIAREAGRRARLQEAGGAIPMPMWIMLLLGAACILGYMLSFADSTEGVVLQCLQAGAVTVLIATSLLLINFLDHPYHPGKGSIEPVSMRFAVQAMERELPAGVGLPCDANGNRS